MLLVRRWNINSSLRPRFARIWKFYVDEINSSMQCCSKPCKSHQFRHFVQNFVKIFIDFANFKIILIFNLFKFWFRVDEKNHKQKFRVPRDNIFSRPKNLNSALSIASKSCFSRQNSNYSPQVLILFQVPMWFYHRDHRFYVLLRPWELFVEDHIGFTSTSGCELSRNLVQTVHSHTDIFSQNFKTKFKF